MYPPRGIRPARGRRSLVTGNKVRSECHCLSHARLSDIEHVNESKGCLRLGLKASSRATLRISHILRGWLRRPIASAGAGASGVSADAGGGGQSSRAPDNNVASDMVWRRYSYLCSNVFSVSIYFQLCIYLCSAINEIVWSAILFLYFKVIGAFSSFLWTRLPEEYIANDFYIQFLTNSTCNK